MDDSLFNPRSVAIVGASPGFYSGGSSFFQAFLAVGFPKEKLFPINPKYEEINGIKSYPSILDVPHPVDYCVIAIPKEFAFRALEECVAKNVKLVCCFTAGFSEIGYEEDERRFVKIAKEGGVRLLGPNCIGIAVPKLRLVFNQGIKAGEEWAGDVSIISQSGGNADMMMIMGNGIGLKFNRVVSYGNGADINANELLENFKNDPDTKLIIEYLEGFKTLEQGKNYLRILRETTRKKPVLVWQGGTTPVGKRSIFGHTGSISGDNRVIKGAFKQAGATLVQYGVPELLHTAVLMSALQKTNKLMKVGPKVGAILGGGGNNVYWSDICTSLGLEFPAFSQETQERLQNLLKAEGTILSNPIDMNVEMFDIKKVIKIMKIFDELEGIDIITFEPGLDWAIMSTNLMHQLNPDTGMVFAKIFDSSMKSLIRNIRKIEKPVIIISAQTFCDAQIVGKRNEKEDSFRRANIPVMNGAETMATAVRHAIEYKEYLLKHSG